MTSDTTEEFFSAIGRPLAPDRGVELAVYDQWGRPSRHPILYNPSYIGAQGSKPAPDIVVEGDQCRLRLEWQHDHLTVINESLQAVLEVNRQPVSQRGLFDGDQLRCDRFRAQVHGLRMPLATLEGYTAPHQSVRWLLNEGANLIGRIGQRVNHVEISDPTVSRAHATLSIDGDHPTLVAESSSSQCKVNGQLLERGQPLALKDSDLLEFGRQVFRFRWFGAACSTYQKGQSVAALSLYLEAPDQAGYTAAYGRIWELAHDCTPLPFDGEALSWLQLSGERSKNLVDPLLELAARIQLALEGSGAVATQCIHLHSADRQPPRGDFASARRVLQVNRAMRGLASGALILSRAAWEASALEHFPRRLGKVETPDLIAPIEVYCIEGN